VFSQVAILQLYASPITQVLHDARFAIPLNSFLYGCVLFSRTKLTAFIKSHLWL